MSKYIDLIAPKTEDEQAAAQRQRDAVEAANDLDGAIASAKKVVAQAETAVAVAKATVPFDVEEVVASLGALADANDDLATLTTLKEELF